jgi:D-lactate dehydrogenase (cytochrome)
MPHWRVRARRPRGDAGTIRVERDADLVRRFIEDAAHFPGGHASGVVAPANEAQVAAALRQARAVLPVGAQSSLTGGATPLGDVVLSTARFRTIEPLAPSSVRVGAGVSLAELEDALALAGRYYPPAPTFTGAFVGGTIATNAAGAATFKYGSTRQWVEAITVVLASGEVLDIERGRTRAHGEGYFEIELDAGLVRVDVPGYTMPRVPKLSAGYYAEPGMDLIDLFIGSEGTLGIVTEATLRVIEPRPAMCLLFVPFDDRTRCLQFVEQVREASRETWRTHDPRGVDVSAIEHMDARCLELLREEGADRACGVSIPASARVALLVTLEMPAGTTAESTYEQLGTGGARDRTDAPAHADGPLPRVLDMLSRAYCSAISDSTALDHVEVAVPGDRKRMQQLLALREAVPAAVNARIGRAQQAVDPRIEKTAADMIVPFDRFGALLDYYDREFARRGLDAAIWGHISDGNVHPNVLPRSYTDVEAGREAILEFGREAIRLGGAPLAEHGVGRSTTKQRLLRELYGEHGIDEMRAIKRALDPEEKLAPGVIFQPSGRR